MGEFKVDVKEDSVHITKGVDDVRYMEIKLKGTGTIVFVSQKDETIIGTSKAIRKESIEEFINFDLSIREVGEKMALLLKGGKG